MNSSQLSHDDDDKAEKEEGIKHENACWDGTDSFGVGGWGETNQVILPEGGVPVHVPRQQPAGPTQSISIFKDRIHYYIYISFYVSSSLLGAGSLPATATAQGFGRRRGIIQAPSSFTTAFYTRSFKDNAYVLMYGHEIEVLCDDFCILFCPMRQCPLG